MADRSVVVRLIADTSSYNNAMRGASQSTRQLGDAGGEAENRLSDLKKAVAGFAVASVIKAGVEFDSLKQRAQAAFTTMTGSAADAKRELADLYTFARTTPFAYPQILKSAQQLTAMGLASKDLIPTLTAIGNGVASIGGTNETFDRISTALGQIQAKGKLSAEEMMQLSEAGIPGWQFVAQQLGVTVPKAMALTQQGAISADVALNALRSGIQDKFGKAMANMGDTWARSVDRFTATARTLGGEIVKPLMNAAEQGMKAIEPLAKQASGLAEEFGALPSPVQNTALALGAVMLMSGRLNSAWANTIATGARFSEQMRVQQQLAAMNGVQINRLGAAMAVARTRAGSLGSGLVGALGGPFGIAITGAVAGLSIYQNIQQHAAAAAQRHKLEVEGLSEALDKNTLSLSQNGRATQVDQFLSEPVPGQGSKSLADMLSARNIDPNLGRRAILGEAGALTELRKQVQASGASFLDITAIMVAVTGKAQSLKEAMDQTASTMRLAIPDAAKQTGVSVQSITGVFNKWEGTGKDLTKMLRGSGIEAGAAAQIYNILAGAASNAAGGMGSAASAAAQMRADIATAAGQFVSIGGAFDSAMSAAQQAASAGSAGRAPNASDDPAYKRAKKAYDDQATALRHLKDADKDRLQPLKDAAKAESDAAAAASKRATALKKVADAAKKASNEAADAVKKAQDQKAQADRNAHDAAALAAAVKQESLHAGTSDQGAYATAVAKANLAATATAQQKAQATATLTAATAAAAAKKAASDAATVAYNRAKAEADAAKKRADAAKKAETDLSRALERIERVYEKQHEKLLDAKNRAEQRAQKKSEAYSSGVSGAYGSMADNVDISLNQYLDTLEKQVKAQRDWKDNLITLASKVPPAIVAQLAKLGPQAAPLVQKLVDGTDRQLGRFVSLFGRTGDQASQRLAGQIQAGSALVSAVAAAAGTDAATKLANAIASGKTTVAQALGVLGAVFDKKTMKIKMGMKNPKDIADALDRLLDHTVYLIKPIKTLVHGQQGFKVTGTTTITGYKDGGWVKGGSGLRDDVPLPSRMGGVQPMAMGGEFVVKKDIASRNKAFFDLMDRTGRMPRPAPQVVYVHGPAGGPSKQVTNYNTVTQLPGQSARDLLRELDRQADLGMGSL